MRLFEAIIQANHRAVGGDATAGLRPSEFAEALPIAALTCIDARLNAFFPNILGVPETEFIWLRNAGNIITGPESSTCRSLALACAVKGAKEIAIIGHSDCQVRKTGAMELMEKFKKLGIDRSALPDNLNEFFGLFASERQNVINAAAVVRESPLIGRTVPVHALLVDIQTGKLDWLVNGYTAPVKSEMSARLAETRSSTIPDGHSQHNRPTPKEPAYAGAADTEKTLGDFSARSIAEQLIDRIGEMKIGGHGMDDIKVGQITAKDFLHRATEQLTDRLPEATLRDIKTPETLLGRAADEAIDWASRVRVVREEDPKNHEKKFKLKIGEAPPVIRNDPKLRKRP